MYCRTCKYDLHKTPVDDRGEGKCPECARGFDRANPNTYWRAGERPTWMHDLSSFLGMVMILGVTLLCAVAAFAFLLWLQVVFQ